MSRSVPRLHLIGPLVVDPVDYPRIAASAARGGCDAIHVRMPGSTTVEMLKTVRAVQSGVGQAVVIVNDRIDVAIVTGAGGVQLGEHSFAIDEARRLLPDDILLGRSVHDVDGAREAASGADYLLAGHVFDTESKAGRPGRGLDWLFEVAAAVSVPVIALGGITVERIPEVMAAGAHGVAIGRELLLADDPTYAAAAAVQAL